MYIEDLIQLVTGTGNYIFGKFPVMVHGNDYKILESIVNQTYYSRAQLTEKQGHLIVKLLKKNREEIRPHVPQIDLLLENPQWKQPFRILPKVKKILTHVSEVPAKGYIKKSILVEFPYEDEIVTIFRKRNQSVHELHKGAWDAELKKWHFAYTESNILWLGNTLLSRGFDSDDEFLEKYNELLSVSQEFESHLPMLVERDGVFEIINAHRNVPQPNTSNVVEALLFARDYGITVWDDKIEQRIQEEVNPIVTKIITQSKDNWFNSETTPIEHFADLFLFGAPVLIVVPGGTELEHLKKWVEFSNKIGIQNEDISVMFRLPNEQADFNVYVKEQALNGPVTDKTKVVFVSTKITKPLVKSGIKFKTAINLGYYNYMHFTMNTMVENTQNLVYYSMKEPTQNKRWQQHVL